MAHSDTLSLQSPSGDSGFPEVAAIPAADAADAFPKALRAAARASGGRRRRDDGWTPARIRDFLRRLADCGVVEDAARAAGMSRQGAYALRNSAGGRAFALAWNAALGLARRRLADEAMSRALEGWTERIIRDGQVWGERNRYDNRLTMRMLERLDRLAAAGDEDSLNTRLVAQEFDEFLEIVCAGGDGADVAAFLVPRLAAERVWVPCREARLLGRLDAYRRDGAGLPGGAGCASPGNDPAPEGR